jgi:hypothetical protein
MKLVTLTMFGAGYVLGTKAGRQRYEQILELARRASEGFDASGAREKLETYRASLEAYARQNGMSPADGDRRAKSRY